MTESLDINLIRTDGGTQSRSTIHKDTVREYAEAIQEGVALPPVTVFYDGETHWLADGFHRLEAYRSLDAREIDADVRQGTRRDAILHSVGSNGDHGLRRTNADKRRAVQTMLENELVALDENGQPWSDRVIAQKCSVSHEFVRGLRGTSQTPASRTGTDGKTYPAPQTRLQRNADLLEKAYNPPSVSGRAFLADLEPQASPSGEVVHTGTGEVSRVADLEPAPPVTDFTRAAQNLERFISNVAESLKSVAENYTPARIASILESDEGKRLGLRAKTDALCDLLELTGRYLEDALESEPEPV